jgi:hypothetical protein
MRISLTSYPRTIPASRYNLAVQQMTEKLKQQKGVLSIFQIGNTKSPGISDIDMLVVFHDNTVYNRNPLNGLSEIDRYLFSHSLYGVKKSDFIEARRYSFFDNYNLLWGEEPSTEQNYLSDDDIDTLKTQIALEYLIKMFVNSTVEKTYGIVRVRGLLVLINALSYDLEFLNISSGTLYDLIQQIISWRDQWFENKPDDLTIKIWFNKFHEELTIFMDIMLKRKHFYMPDWANKRIATNMILIPSKKFGYVHKGITLPPVFGRLGRKYFNIQHRFNKFQFKLPVMNSNIPDCLLKRFAFIRNIRKKNNKNLPNFIPMTSSLNI